MTDRRDLSLTISIALASCSPEPSTMTGDNVAADAPRVRQPQHFNGWGSFKFGMSFDDAIIAQTGVRWDGESFRKCRDEMPIRGCTLWASEDSYVPLTAGVALLPHLSFNQKAELTTIDMTERLEGEVTPAQCERAHGQLLDYLDAEWGPGKSRETEYRKLLKRTTPKGRVFYRTTDGESVFVMDIEDFNKLPDGRHLSIISHYSKASEYTKARCWLSIYFEGPKNLERPPYEQPKELAGAAKEADAEGTTVDDSTTSEDRNS